MFNHRRQSQDRMLRERILELAGGRTIWMSPYSARQFCPEVPQNIRQAENPLAAVGNGEFCFVEGQPLAPHEAGMEEVVLFRWNRVYPADAHFDIPLEQHGWKLAERSEFPGYSHEKITQEVYRR